ncbi:MAG: nitrate/nitrite transporter NrtS [Bacteroidetes bacterium]|nr:nitrate/nitrite transporter NrtS [Bacteroidota bacterium]
MRAVNTLQQIKLYLFALINPAFVPSSIKVAILVGTILLFINHGWAIWNQTMTAQRWLSAVLSYIVPYMVNTYAKFSVNRNNQ